MGIKEVIIWLSLTHLPFHQMMHPKQQSNQKLPKKKKLKLLMFMEMVFITSKHSYLRYCKLLSGTRIITGMEEKGKGYYTRGLLWEKPDQKRGNCHYIANFPWWKIYIFPEENRYSHFLPGGWGGQGNKALYNTRLARVIRHYKTPANQNLLLHVCLCFKCQKHEINVNFSQIPFKTV